MLILTRRIGETIQIGDEIEVKVLAISKNRVKIGSETPRHILVMRGETYANGKRKDLPPAEEDPADKSDEVAGDEPAGETE